MLQRRRSLLRAFGLAVLMPKAFALTAERPFQGSGAIMLDPDQSDRFRVWMNFIVAEQFKRGPSPRWRHRDCAGLVRYAVGETLRSHDLRWRNANGWDQSRLPPELVLRAEQAGLRNTWQGIDGTKQAFVTAQALVQNNSRPLGKESAMARPGDLLFFDQSDEQHLMIWMGSWIAYHNGQTPVNAPQKRQSGKFTVLNEDNGLRAVTPAELFGWKDTRWRPRENNPNFAGFYRLAFLSR